MEFVVRENMEIARIELVPLEGNPICLQGQTIPLGGAARGAGILMVRNGEGERCLRTGSLDVVREVKVSTKPYLLSKKKLTYSSNV